MFHGGLSELLVVVVFRVQRHDSEPTQSYKSTSGILIICLGYEWPLAHAGFRGGGIEGARIYMTGLMGSDSGFTT